MPLGVGAPRNSYELQDRNLSSATGSTADRQPPLDQPLADPLVRLCPRFRHLTGWPGSGRQHLFFLVTQGEIGCVALPAIATAHLFAGGEDLSTWHRRLGRFYDIGWLYTVIAGFMNLLVIYDALCGPMRLADKDRAGAEPGADDPGRQGRPAR